MTFYTSSSGCVGVVGKKHEDAYHTHAFPDGTVSIPHRHKGGDKLHSHACEIASNGQWRIIPDWPPGENFDGFLKNFLDKGNTEH